ncbi:MAG TPA: decarboxylating 6-phosphogluconate dehydrogenase, partial [Gaiellaceae bacterium]|nr:decarboxylating 6-phosphogluconate dehydrogenase [Gaiellaceae bacterium]
MRLGMVGLGRMGGNMAERLRRDGHDVMGYARSGGGTASSLEELVGQLEQAPRVVWLMIPAGAPTDATFTELLGLLEEGDVIVDGGNSNFRDSQRRHAVAAEHGIQFVDAGVSGGIWGLEVGYCIMAGGDREAVEIVEPAFEALAPEAGYAHVGSAGAGHFVKMVHNGVEYALMSAYAEGYEMLAAEELVQDPQAVYQAWTNGTVVRSWLQQLLAKALKEDPGFAQISGYTEDSGEGRWTVEEAIRLRVPV